MISRSQLQAGGTLSPGLVYGVFAEKLFWGGDGKQPKPDSPVGLKLLLAGVCMVFQSVPSSLPLFCCSVFLPPF